MINFEHESLEATLKKAYDNVRGLKRKTKELICVGLTVMMLGSFVLYDAAAGVAYAAGGGEGTPHAIMAGDEEVAVLQSKADADMVVENIKKQYGKDNSLETAMITPAISVVEKEYVTAEAVDVKTISEATEDILAQNATDDPYFEVVVKQPVVGKQKIAHKTKTVETDELEKGEKKVTTKGKDGEKIVTGESVLINGEVVSTEVFSEEMVSEPVTEVVAKGTKEPEPEAEEVEATADNTAAQTSTSSSSSSSANTGSSYKAPAYNASTSGGIVGYAQSFHGVPYVWGGASPSGFDCSGFTMYVYSAFGVSLPHSSGGQAGCGYAVSASEARPGDLVVMPGHVGIYVGNGMLVHSPGPGQSVKTQAIWQGCSFRRLV